MKSRMISGLAVIAIVTLFATTSFAQISVTVNNSAISPGEVSTNRNAATSDTNIKDNGILISGSLLAASALTNTGIRLTFPGPITSTFLGAPVVAAGGVPDEDPVRIMGNVGIFAAAAISTINYSAGTIDLVLPTFDNSAGTSGSFRVVGLRTDTTGKSGPQNATVSYTPGSSGANNYLLASSTVPLMSSVASGLVAPAIGALAGSAQVNAGTALIFNNLTVADSGASFVLTEGFASAWKTAAQASSSATALSNGTNVRLRTVGVPPGMSVTVTPVFITTGNTVTLSAAAQTTGVFTATGGAATQDLVWAFTATDTSVVEAIGFSITLVGTPTSATPGTNMTVTASFAPIGNALTTGGFPTESGGYPRFADSALTVTFGTVAQATTTLLIPYMAKGFGLYDTGIAISNTTLDPFGTAGGGATPTAGALTITIYQRGSTTPIVLSTSSLTASQAAGIVSGVIPAGGIFTAALSQILPASAAADFVGYAFVQADFLNAHGISYLFESGRITSATPVLVLFPPSGTPRTGTEQLGF